MGPILFGAVASAGSPALPPVNTALPVISQTGSVLSVTTGTWTGTAPITYAYQFTRNGTPVGAPSASQNYTIPDGDLNALFGCIVTATNSGGNASAAAALLYVGVMDVLSVAPAANFELRRESRSYTGNAIRVRRSSDNAEANIGFTAIGELDAEALLNFVGSGNGFITILYDKSGNGRNATQTTPDNQPQIVSNGAIITQGGRPALRFDGVNDYLAAASPLIGTTHSLFILFTPTIENEFGTVFGQWSSGQNGRFYVIANQVSAGPISAGRLNVANPTALGGNGTNGLAADVAISNTLTLITSISTTGSEQWKLFKNGAEWDSATITTVFTGVNSAIGSLNGLGSSLPFDGTFSGLTSFPSVLSTAERQLIERNRGAYYGIPIA
jgi:hypothetical protein